VNDDIQSTDDPEVTDAFTAHDVQLLRRGLKSLRYELAKKARKSTFVPVEGSKDITKTNLELVEALLPKVDKWLKAAQKAEKLVED
jgi:hypothetical protein